MNYVIWILLSVAMVLPATSVHADKPEWAGQKGGPTERQKEQHREEMRSKNHDDDRLRDRDDVDEGYEKDIEFEILGGVIKGGANLPATSDEEERRKHK